MNKCAQILESINIGIVIIDKDFCITEWNNWMTVYSNKTCEDVRGKSIFDVYPELDKKSFSRGCKAVFTFGNLVFLSSTLHKYLFPFKIQGSNSTFFTHMQQSCYLIPIRNDDDEVDHVMINVHDETENAVLDKQLKELTYIDGLTRAYNRRAFERRLQEEFARHKRTGIPLGIIMFDLDFFKIVNDTYGHQFGDKVLQNVVSACSDCLRTEDFLARYGGEEFVCLLTDQNIDQTRLVAERLRERIEQMTIEEGASSVSVTISAVIADSANCDNRVTLLKMADEGLYAAKRKGRNRVEESDK